MTSRAPLSAIALLVSFLFAGSRSDGYAAPPAASSAASANTVTNNGLDLTRLPLGDGKVASSPQVGYVYSCQTSFNPNGPGTNVNGPWIDTKSDTYDFTAKSVVQGSVAWPNASFTIALNADRTQRNVSTNDLPNHNTGTFPISRSDPGYAYDFNPNHIAAQTVVYSMPQMPALAAKPSCASMGPIGVMLSGSLLFNALDAKGHDAVAHEEQDHCQGHPDPSSAYHYHSLTTCIPDPGTGHSNLLGYAMDGFGIYGVRGENGKPLTNADLDACHGHTHAILWDGQTVVMYHYHATYEYPYSIGCFAGTPARTALGRGPQGNGPPRNGQRPNGPPPNGPPGYGPPPGFGPPPQ